MNIFENLPSAALQLDAEWRVVKMNAEARKLLRCNQGNKTLPEFRDFLNADDIPAFSAFLKKLSVSIPQTFSTILIPKAEIPISITLRASLTHDENYILILHPQNVYTNGCGSTCRHAAILEAQYHNNPGGILLVNGNMEMISFNQEFVRIWNLPLEIQQSRDEEASLNYVLDQLTAPAEFLAKVQKLYRNRNETSTDEVYLRDGRTLYRHTYPIFSKGEHIGRVWYFLDITPLKQAISLIEKQQILQNSILDNVSNGIAACDSSGKLILFNRASRELFDLDKDAPLPENLQQLGFYNEDGSTPAGPGEGPLARTLRGETLKNHIVTIIPQKGEQRVLQVNGQAMQDSEGDTLGAVVSLHDITDLNTVKEQLQFMAYHDALTYLPNRRLFHDILQQNLKHASRYEEQVAVLFLDLDNFKSINDQYGHDRGDQVLQIIAKTLQGCLRESDLLCRWGGDEFVLALLESGKSNDVTRIAEKIRNRILSCITREKTVLPISVSIGIALFPNHATEPDLLIRNADMAMYKAKRLGKNRCQFFEPEMIAFSKN
ncbi:MAG: diguanylate cyclase [Desulfopila sp.]|nr:diguanylate cyclase [Desulfopila sp.]